MKVRSKSVAHFRLYLSASGSQFSCFDQVRTDIQGAPKVTHQLVNRYYTVLSSATIPSHANSFVNYYIIIEQIILSMFQHR